MVDLYALDRTPMFVRRRQKKKKKKNVLTDFVSSCLHCLNDGSTHDGYNKHDTTVCPSQIQLRRRTLENAQRPVKYYAARLYIYYSIIMFTRPVCHNI